MLTQQSLCGCTSSEMRIMFYGLTSNITSTLFLLKTDTVGPTANRDYMETAFCCCWSATVYWTVSSLDIRRDLHWLPVSLRITFQLCLLTRKTLHTAHPPYLSELVTHYLPSKALRSSNTNLLARPSGITSNFTSRAFSVSAPSTWNSLPTHSRSLDKLSTFKRQLKSHLFQSAFAA